MFIGFIDLFKTTNIRFFQKIKKEDKTKLLMYVIKFSNAFFCVLP